MSVGSSYSSSGVKPVIASDAGLTYSKCGVGLRAKRKIMSAAFSAMSRNRCSLARIASSAA